MTTGTGALHSTDRKSRIISELKNFALMTLYLWCVFQTFEIYRALVLKEHGINRWEQSFAILNALIFAKVVMTGQLFKIGRRLRQLPIVYAAAGHALVFAIIILLFSIAEHVVKALVKGLPAAEGVADVGGGNFLGMVALAILFLAALLPFFAVQEFSHLFGESKVRDLFFTRDKERYKLVRE